MNLLRHLSSLTIQNSTLKRRLNFLFLLLILLVSSRISAQTRAELEQKRFDIIQEIDNTNELLKLTAKNKTVILSDLSILESQIGNRKLLLEQIQKEIDAIDEDIEKINVEHAITSVRVDSLKSQYDIILRAVYRERSLHNPLVNLLSSESVAQGFLRANFYNRLKEYIKEKLDDISSEQSKLEAESAQLNKDKNVKREVLQQEAQQSALLDNEIARQKVMISSLQEDELTLKDNLQRQRQNREQMNVQIEGIIKAGFVVDESTRAASAFSALKGKMKWPIEGGVVSSRYGKQRHPTMKNLTITNNGIDIRAPLEAIVKAVYSGKVVSVSEMSGFGVTIILEHEQYYTVYSKLEKAYVKMGDQVAQNMNLGFLEVENESSELHFEIWKDNTTQNPVDWLVK